MKRMICLLAALAMLMCGACAESLTLMEEFVLSFVADEDADAQWVKINGEIYVDFQHKQIPSTLRVRDRKEYLEIEISPYVMIWLGELHQWHSVRYAVQEMNYSEDGVLKIVFSKERMYSVLQQRGNMYCDELDYTMAMRYYKTAAEQQDDGTNYALLCEVCYQAGALDDALYYAEIGAQKLDFECMYYLADAYAVDLDDRESVERAIALYTQLAEYGESHACFLLSNLWYEIGDAEQGRIWLEKGAEMGSGWALSELAYTYQDTDPEKYAAYLEAAEKTGDLFAAHVLTQFYYYDEEHRNLDKAIYYYVRVMQHGNANQLPFTLEELLAERDAQ